MNCDHKEIKIQRAVAVGGKRIETFFACAACRVSGSMVWSISELRALPQHEVDAQARIVLQQKPHTEGSTP